MEKEMFVIQNREIQESLVSSARQYLVGKLNRPQMLRNLEDEKLEIGITSYDQKTSESPHYHTQAYEYQYVMDGLTEYLDIDTGKVCRFEKGDFYVTPPGLVYAQRALPGTAIFFVKAPPGDDKVTVEPTEDVEAWMNAEIEAESTD